MEILDTYNIRDDNHPNKNKTNNNQIKFYIMETKATKTVKAQKETTNIATVATKTPIVRKTSDEKIVDLKNAIERQFGVSQDQITNFTISRLSKSSKKTNLVDFYRELIVELVTKPETLNKF